MLPDISLDTPNIILSPPPLLPSLPSQPHQHTCPLKHHTNLHPAPLGYLTFETPSLSLQPSSCHIKQHLPQHHSSSHLLRITFPPSKATSLAASYQPPSVSTISQGKLPSIKSSLPLLHTSHLLQSITPGKPVAPSLLHLGNPIFLHTFPIQFCGEELLQCIQRRTPSTFSTTFAALLNPHTPTKLTYFLSPLTTHLRPRHVPFLLFDLGSHFTQQQPDKMAPSNTKTNFKSFEVQARLLRAIVAAHPEVKWNYKGEHFSSCLFLSLSLVLGPQFRRPPRASPPICIGPSRGPLLGPRLFTWIRGF